MSKLKSYISYLQQKPEHQREKIAIAATAVSFAIIFVIWLVSFNEMNKSADSGASAGTSAPAEDLKNNLGSGAKSIQEMFQQLPSDQNLDGTGQSAPAAGNAETGSGNMQDLNMPDSGGSDAAGNVDTQNMPNAEGSSQNGNGIPELP